MSEIRWRIIQSGASRVVVTHRLWRTTAQQNETHLMLTLMMEYDGLNDSIDALQTWHREQGSPENARESFRAGLDRSDPAIMGISRPHRFRVSRFFVKIRKLARGGYLSEDLIRAALDRDAVDVFLTLVDPLDQVVRERAGKQPEHEDRGFFTALRERY